MGVGLGLGWLLVSIFGLESGTVGEGGQWKELDIGGTSVMGPSRVGTLVYL